MSKPYFAKYIPVEGEIKDGDLYINPKMKNRIILPRAYGNDDSSYVGFQKVKLFLCSRDINWTEDLKESGKVHIHHDGSEPPFKVVGKVSPEATWVKEGDEFEEHHVRKYIELEIYYADASEQWQTGLRIIEPEKEYIPRKEKGYDESITYETIQIKGPCGHFH